MKKLTVALADYYTESHNNAVVKTLELLDGVNIIARTGDTVEFECSDEALEVISDMNVCDYMMVRGLD